MKEINIREIGKSPVGLINDDWGLLCAGNEEKRNSMTVSWGGVGELWNRDVVFVFVRPQRFTKEFIDSEEYFTLSFFDESKKDALKICGSKSGRDIDKEKECSLTPVFCENGFYYDEAQISIICRKIAVQKMEPDGFLDESIKDNYKNADYHYTYVGEIKKVIKK